MSYCDTCIHHDVCGVEGVDDEGMTYCADRLEPCDDAISIQVVIEWLKAKDILKLSSQEETARKELKALTSVGGRGQIDGYWNVSKQNNDGERELIDRAVKALETELANRQVVSKLVASEDAISRRATVERLCKVAEFMNEKRNGLGSPYVMAALFIQDNKDEFPPVTPKQRIGHWIRKTNDYGASSYMCSECGRWHPTHNHSLGFDYCNGCGAKMVEPQERSE